MVVGLQGRGKTTLLSVLRDPTAPLPENISTVGVNVADWVVKAPPEVIKKTKGSNLRVRERVQTSFKIVHHVHVQCTCTHCSSA